MFVAITCAVHSAHIIGNLHLQHGDSTDSNLWSTTVSFTSDLYHLATVWTVWSITVSHLLYLEWFRRRRYSSARGRVWDFTTLVNSMSSQMSELVKVAVAS